MSNYKTKNLILNDIYKGNSLLKYAYLEKGANNFLDVVLNPSYDIYKNEIKILKKNKDAFQKILKENIVVLGVGNGDKIKILLDGFNFKTLTLVDLSKKMISIAKQNLSKYNLKIINKDFEEIDFSQFQKNTSFIFLGGTLFNFNNWDLILKKLKNNFSNSNIIIGVELLNKTEDVNLVSKQYKKESVFDFLTFPLRFIGLNKKDGLVKQVYNKKERSIDTYFIFKNSNDKVNFKDNKIKKIILCRSIKLFKNDFFKKIEDYEVILDCNLKNNQIIALRL